MITTLRKRLGMDSDESGFSLVEVIIAMVIFAITSTGILFGLLSVLKLTRDSRAYQVATNLAAQEIDLVRATPDIFSLDDYTYPTQTLNGDEFIVKRTTKWETSLEDDVTCGSGGNPLRYKSVKVTVTWVNMSPGNQVETYTVLNPTERINDPSKGTIIVTVRGASGNGVEGVGVSASPASPANGATALTVTPTATNSQGCSYILKVTPGNYNVTASKSGYISNTQEPVATKFAQVAVGTSVAVSFDYDLAAKFPIRYASNSTGSPVIPTDMATSFISADAIAIDTATSSNRTRTVSLYPFIGGYSAVAGAYVAPNGSNTGCPAVDPASWAPQTILGVTYAASRAPATSADPGDTASQSDVPMGIFNVAGTSSNRFLKAVSQDGGLLTGGTPACSQGMTYNFGQVLPNSSANTLIALPYGNWKLFTGTSVAGATNAVAATRISLVSGQRGSVNLLTGVLTLDPRVPQ